MFGYLKYSNGNKKSLSWRTYKCYYCGLCNALKRNYGTLSTLFLSNDVTFLSIIIANGKENGKKIKPACCLKRTKKNINKRYSDPFWDSMAIFTLALVYAKAYDNCVDGESFFKSRIYFFIINLLTSKARKKNPQLFEYMKKSMESLHNNQSEDWNVLVQGQMFADVVTTSLDSYLSFNVDSESLAMISSVMKWLCFVDAVDDYEKDYKRDLGKSHSENPIIHEYLTASNGHIQNNIVSSGIKKYPTWKNLFNSQYLQIVSTYSEIISELLHSAKKSAKKTPEAEIIRYMVNVSMPEKIFSIINRKRIVKNEQSTQRISRAS